MTGCLGHLTVWWEDLAVLDPGKFDQRKDGVHFVDSVVVFNKTLTISNYSMTILISRGRVFLPWK